MERYFWTNKERAIIAEHYPTGGAEACVPHLPRRTKRSIYQQARKMGIMYGDNKPKIRKRWESNDEIDGLIVRCYQSNPEKGAVKALANRLRRPYWWVKKRASYLGVAQPALSGNKEPEWSRAEVELLEKHSHKHPGVIAKIFRNNGYRRTATAIVVKRKRLGYSNLDIDHYTATQLAGEFGVDIKVVTRWIEKGWLKATRRGTERTVQQGGDMWWIKRKDIRTFIVDSIGIIDIRKVDKTWFVDLLVAP